MIEGYEIFKNKVIKQIDPKPFVYDEKYVEDRYDTYGIECDKMSNLRLGYIVGTTGGLPTSVLDIGYGNGSFLKICKEGNIKTFGTDVSNYGLKHGEFVEFDDIFNKTFDVITMFDSMEHFHDLEFLKKLNCKYLCISVPLCHYNNIYYDNAIAGDKYFTEWKHRRPDEHIWHFDSRSLIKFMKEHGYKNIAHGTVEDVIRKPTDGRPNILTAVFKKSGSLFS